MTVTENSETTARRADRHRDRQPQLPAPVRPQRRWVLVAIGVALLAVSVLGMNTLLARASDSTTVLALASTVERGDVIEAGDLVTVKIPAEESSLQTIPEDQRGQIAGQVATSDLLAGTTLTPSAVARELTPPEGKSIVGFSLTAGQLPATDLHTGDHVRIVDTPVSQGDPPAGEPTTYSGTVLTVETDPVSGTTLVDVQLDSDVAAQVAVRAYTGRAALVLDSSEN